jgi:hypothetical protein
MAGLKYKSLTLADLNLPVLPDTRGRLNPDGTITPVGPHWALNTDEQAAAYEIKRAAIIAENERLGL